MSLAFYDKSWLTTSAAPDRRFPAGTRTMSIEGARLHGIEPPGTQVVPSDTTHLVAHMSYPQGRQSDNAAILCEASELPLIVLAVTTDPSGLPLSFAHRKSSTETRRVYYLMSRVGADTLHTLEIEQFAAVDVAIAETLMKGERPELLTPALRRVLIPSPCDTLRALALLWLCLHTQGGSSNRTDPLLSSAGWREALGNPEEGQLRATLRAEIPSDAGRAQSGELLKWLYAEGTGKELPTKASEFLADARSYLLHGKLPKRWQSGVSE